jgi:hypothetical protein
MSAIVGCYVGCTPPVVPSGTTSHLAPVVAPVAHVVGQMPFTGLDVGELLALGLIAVATGLALLFKRRSLDTVRGERVG